MIQQFQENERQNIVQLGQKDLKNNLDVLNYLTNERWIKSEVLDLYKVGYCPRNVDHQLAGRIIMPLYDEFDNLITITTRNYQNNNFKFWHEAYDKSEYLYGLNVAKNDIIELDEAIVVEGQMDVMCLHSYGIRNVVGLCGSTLSISQICSLIRYCKKISFLLDPDEAGNDGLTRIMKVFYQYKLNYYVKFNFCNIPTKQDPDEYIHQNGRDNFMQLIKKEENNGSLLML